MKCSINFLENNKDINYWCLSHKTKATAINNQKPSFCDCKYKDLYENITKMKKEDIKDIKIIYPDLNKGPSVKVFINNREFNGILQLENSIIDLKDYGGLMLSKLNKINLKESKCPYCVGMHTDNGKFAYTAHSTHLCTYCGHLFRVNEANVGNELALYFNFPDISLEDKIILINEKCEVTYDLFTGDLLINNTSFQKVKLNEKEIDIVSFLNNSLKNEY